MRLDGFSLRNQRCIFNLSSLHSFGLAVGRESLAIPMTVKWAVRDVDSSRPSSNHSSVMQLWTSIVLALVVKSFICKALHWGSLSWYGKNETCLHSQCSTQGGLCYYKYCALCLSTWWVRRQRPFCLLVSVKLFILLVGLVSCSSWTHTRYQVHVHNDSNVTQACQSLLFLLSLVCHSSCYFWNSHYFDFDPC